MSFHVAIVGTGPTGVYCLKYLLDRGAADAITLFERGDQAGVGMPYSPETASRAMLANIASVEIPPLECCYLEWLEGQSAAHLRSFGLNPDDLDDRQFTPRLLLGQYFGAQMQRLIERAGADLTVATKTEIVDVLPEGERLCLRDHHGQRHGPFDRVVLATGHSFAGPEAATARYFPNPWSGLISDDIPAGRVGILGTSLSALDAATAVATQHGAFRRRGSEREYQLLTPGLEITLMSRHGILPEADFYCPIPYQPLRHMTAEALERAGRAEGVLDAAFALLQQELGAADPAYAHEIGLPELTADTFAEAYFAARQRHDPFQWARHNLEEAERNKRERKTVAWRYALLCMHEQVETLVPKFSDDDRERFARGLKRVFVDNYGAVPAESIRRLLALRDAGVLKVLALGEDYEQAQRGERTCIRYEGGSLEFDVFIDARGQKALTTEDLPLPTLRRELLADGQEIPEVADDYSLLGPKAATRRVYLAAIPYLMHDHPFCQGITASAAIGEAIAESCAEAKAGGETPARRRQRLWRVC